MRKQAIKIGKRLNKEIFNGWLPDLNVKVAKKPGKMLRGCFALYWNNTVTINEKELRKYLKNLGYSKIKYRHVFVIMAHEIIHHAQNYFELGFGHNSKFFRHYAKRMQEYYGIPFKIAARQPIDYRD